MSNVHFEALLAKVRREQAEAVTLIGDVTDLAIVKHHQQDQWFMILPDVSGHGRWRLQSFDLSGFSGHMVFSCKVQAIHEAASLRFTVRDDGALERLQDTPDFQIGLFAVEQLALHNRGAISFEDYLENVRAFKDETYGLRLAA